MSTFEVFRSRGARRSGPTDTVTIGRRGELLLGQDAYRQLGEPKSVELLYDREAHTIGIRSVDSDADTAYRVRHSGKTSHAVAGTAFLRHYGIPFSDVAVRRRATASDGVLCVDLNTPGVEVISNRAKS